MDDRAWNRWWRVVGRPGLLVVLARDWAPLGADPALPADEYECVSGRIATLLRAGAPDGRIAEVLTEYRSEHLGLEPAASIDRHAAKAISAWYAVANLLVIPRTGSPLTLAAVRELIDEDRSRA